MKKILYILSAAALIWGCTPKAEDKLNEGIELYKNGEIEKAAAYIEEGLAGSAQIKKITVNNLLYGKNILYYREETLETAWPVELSIEIDEDYNIIFYDPASGKLGLSNGSDIKIYDDGGNPVMTFSPAQDDKALIEAFIIKNEKVYYYKNTRIFVYDLFSGNERQLTDHKFYKPFTDDVYNVSLYNAENLLVVVIGIGGNYNLSIFDLLNNTIIVQNLKTASSKIFLKNKILYYISGNAGKYSLSEVPVVSSGKKKNLVDFDILLDIEFFSTGIIYENREGIWIFEYGRPGPQKIPFSYELYSECLDNPVLKYSETYYIINMPEFLNKMAYIKEAVHDLVNPIKAE